MLFKYKRGQVTIFVILGLLLVVGLIIFLTMTRSPELTVVSSSVSMRLENYVRQCGAEIIDDYVQRALLSGGYGFYPNNIVRSNKDVYVVSYSAEGVSIGIQDRATAENFILNEFRSYMGVCLSSLINVDKELYGDTLGFNLLSAKFNVESDVIIAEYFYSYFIDDSHFDKTVIMTKYTSLGFFLDETRRVTDEILIRRRTDNLFNYQFCNSLFETKGFYPKYRVDFLLALGNKYDFLFEREFFVIFLEKGSEVFSFAIIPEHVDNFC